MSFVAGKLPSGVSPQLGPDATGVGWVYEYVLLTGKYCTQHPDGVWHDPAADSWYGNLNDVDDDSAVRRRLVHHRIFRDPRVVYADLEESRRYDSIDEAPPERRDHLQELEIVKGYDRCPLDGTTLEQSGMDLSDLRGLQDWYLRYELTAVDGVSEVASLGGFVKQYQVVVDPACRDGDRSGPAEHGRDDDHAGA